MSENNHLFVYGILKRGFHLDLERPEYGGKFVGEAFIPGSRLYALGAGVGLRFSGDPLEVAHGEIFEINPGLWHYLDGIEANGRTYTRKIVTCILEGDKLKEIEAWVYEHTYFSEDGYKRLPVIEGGVYKKRSMYD